MPVFHSKLLVSNINYYLDVCLIKTQMLLKESKFNEVLRLKKFIAQKKVVEWQ